MRASGVWTAGERAEGDLHPFVLTLLPLPKWGYSVGNCVKSRAKGSCERSEATI